MRGKAANDSLDNFKMPSKLAALSAGHTCAAVVPEARFDLFQGAVALYDADDADRAVYVGLTGPIGRGSLSLLVDATDQDGTGTVTVDLRTADGWRAVGVDDRTAALRRRGMLTLTLDVDPVTVRLFGTERVWLLCRGRRETVAASPLRVLHLLGFL